MLCALCQTQECKEDSHIVPAFAYRWLKRRSLTGYIRGSREPNLRMTDGPKPRLLCPACEDMFSVWEDRFAKEVFYPVHRDGITDLKFGYDNWLSKFCVSLSWRVLKHAIDEHPGLEFPHGHSPLLQPTLEVWRDYVLGRRPEISYHRQHLVILGHDLSLPAFVDPAELSLYFDRGIDHNTVHSATDAYVITKLCRILIAGTIFTKKPSDWQHTQVHIAGGKYGSGTFQVAGCVFTFFQTAIQETVQSRTRISPQQSKKIADAVYRKAGVPCPKRPPS